VILDTHGTRPVLLPELTSNMRLVVPARSRQQQFLTEAELRCCHLRLLAWRAAEPVSSSVLTASSSSLYTTADDLLIGSVHISLADIMAVRKSTSRAGSALAALFDPLVHSSNDDSIASVGSATVGSSVSSAAPERPGIAKSRTQRLGSLLRGASHKQRRSGDTTSSSKSTGSCSSSGDAAAAAASTASTSSARSTLRRAPSIAAAAFASAGRRGSAMLSPHQLAAGCWYKFDCALVKNGRVTGRVQVSHSLRSNIVVIAICRYSS
jgi:hypothetical protein